MKRGGLAGLLPAVPHCGSPWDNPKDQMTLERVYGPYWSSYYMYIHIHIYIHIYIYIYIYIYIHKIGIVAGYVIWPHFKGSFGP